MESTTIARARRSPRHWRVLASAMLLGSSIVMAACGSSAKATAPSTTLAPTSTQATLAGTGKPTIVLGDKNFAEEYTLGQLYAQLWRANGFTVTLRSNIGGSLLIDHVFLDGKINAYPEYVGTIVSPDAHYNKPVESEAQTYEIAEAYEAKHGATILTPVTPFFDTDELVVPKGLAARYHLSTIGGLKNLPSVKICGPADFADRYEGAKGLREAYHLSHFSLVPIAPGLQYNALDKGECNVAVAFSTDPQLLSGKYTPLSDTAHIFGFQHVGIVIKQALLSKLGPHFRSITAALTDLLTTHALQTLNRAVEVDKDAPESVAHAFLKANHLLQPESFSS
jgi:osmoprotectant transport system substrate-binding protein